MLNKSEEITGSLALNNTWDAIIEIDGTLQRYKNEPKGNR
jgi:hypothetical protein